MRIARSFDDGLSECGLKCPASVLSLDKRLVTPHSACALSPLAHTYPRRALYTPYTPLFAPLFANGQGIHAVARHELRVAGDADMLVDVSHAYACGCMWLDNGNGCRLESDYARTNTGKVEVEPAKFPC